MDATVGLQIRQKKERHFIPAETKVPSRPYRLSYRSFHLEQQHIKLQEVGTECFSTWLLAAFRCPRRPPTVEKPHEMFQRP